jgi:hypothetical protein
MRPATILSITVFALTALGIITVNDRLDLWGARGYAGMEGVSLGFLALSSVVVAGIDLISKARWFPYALTPITAVVVVLGYTFGTIRLD